jgi:hypothetical protein
MSANKLRQTRRVVAKIIHVVESQLGPKGAKTVTPFHFQVFVETLEHRYHEHLRGRELPVDWRT